MISAIGIKYCDTCSVRYVQTEQAFPVQTKLVISDGKGSRLAVVNSPIKSFSKDDLPKDMPSVLRPATDMDYKAYQQNLQLATQSKQKVAEMIDRNGLDMTLVDIVFSLERRYVLITFTAQERVDFRQLLKDLAAYFKTRIELRQINSREEARVYGGLGPCGRPLCCSSFLGEFPPVSIKMLKHQGLSLNSAKSLGCCGRLLCCLQYEDDFYQESKKKFPDYGTIVRTAQGPGEVAGIDLFTDTIQVRFKDQLALVTYALEEVKVSE